MKYQLGYGLKILFIGINPHPGSDRRGVPYSNNKMFWYLLSAAGLIEEDRSVLKDDVQLKFLYENHFKNKYKFGLLNVADEPSRTAQEINKAEVIPGRKRIMDAIITYKPRVVCFVGKITYNLFIGSSGADYGWQPDIASSKIYMSHVPHRGWASVRIEELQEVFSYANK
jgi:double-stranded uracil-DNA glycosylase